MAVSKRKENPISNFHVGRTPKKPRKEDELASGSKRARDLETATDSDPIVESDTTSQSGVDDAVSWPSDEEEKDVGVANSNDEEGMKIAEATVASKPAKNTLNTNGTGSGSSEKIILVPV